MKIGNSLAFGVQDILAGKIAEDDVFNIRAETDAATDEQWATVFQAYRASYWLSNPDEGEAVARRLIAAGKVEQPRLRGEPIPSVAEGTWVEAF
jgi:hypothetical protein